MLIIGITQTSYSTSETGEASTVHCRAIRHSLTSYLPFPSGPLLRTRIGTDAASRLLRPIKAVNPAFLPYTARDDSEDTDGASENLFEVVVPADADDCPPPAFCGPDGYYHTGDIFQKVDDGWVYRGRAGDWIKVLGGFVDTKCVSPPPSA